MEVPIVQRRRHRRLVGMLAGLYGSLVLPHAQPAAGDYERASAVVPESGRYRIVRPVHAVVLEALETDGRRRGTERHRAGKISLSKRNPSFHSQAMQRRCFSLTLLEGIATVYSSHRTPYRRWTNNFFGPIRSVSHRVQKFDGACAVAHSHL